MVLKRLFILFVSVGILLNLNVAADAVNWQITGYSPQGVTAGGSTNAVTLNGSFSIDRENRKVKIGAGGTTYDLSPGIVAWTQGQIKVQLPHWLPPNDYWFGIYAPDENLLVKGPQTFWVKKPLSLVYGNSHKPGLPAGAKGRLTINSAELEIRKINGLPGHLCAGGVYPVSMTVINHGGVEASFHVCTAGSLSFQCIGGMPSVYRIKAKSTKVVQMNIQPDKTFIVNDKWHGKIFLGKVKTPSPGGQLTLQGQGNPSPTGCNEGVTTSWTNAPGLSVGTLFCDGNMKNHLRTLEIKVKDGCGNSLKGIGVTIPHKKKWILPKK